jgi:hypothetical protein
MAAIRRVLVGLSSADTPTAMLDLATQLAHAFNAEIAGLFVEEDMLYQVGDYTSLQMVGRGGRPEAFEPGRIGAELAAQARAWRRALSARAEQGHVHWSFESRRGDALTIFRGSARADDVLLIGGTASTITLKARIARAMGESLLILTRARSQDAETHGGQARTLELASEEPGPVALLLRRLEPRLVVAHSAGPIFADVGIAAGLMQAAGAPFLLLRSGV